jgi:hypothetical protein
MYEYNPAVEGPREPARPGFDSFGNPAPTTVGKLGGATTPPAITLSRRPDTSIGDELDRQALIEPDLIDDKPEYCQHGVLLDSGCPRCDWLECISEPQSFEQGALREFVEGD